MDKSQDVATTTISVYTRHSPDCSKREDPTWKRCNCRKALYIYENGRDRRVSAKTRSWAAAQDLATAELAKRDPVKRALQELKEREEAKAAEEAARLAKRTTVVDALAEWVVRKGAATISTASAHRIFTRKVAAWALRQKITYMDEITKRALDQWQGAWSSSAVVKDDRMGSRTAQLFQGRLREFLRWACVVDILDKDPTAVLTPIKVESAVTMPLTPEQFEELLAADWLGTELRSLILVMRWTGLRLSDVVMMQRASLSGNRLRLITQKTKARYDEQVPDVVISALAAVRPRAGVHPDYYFWSRTCTYRTLVATWCERVKEVSRFLNFVDELGQPMPFHSHMLRDTFAVELFLQGVPLEDVSRMLTHKSIAVTEKHYSPFVKRRKQLLDDRKVEAMKKMGATFTA